MARGSCRCSAIAAARQLLLCGATGPCRGQGMQVSIDTIRTSSFSSFSFVQNCLANFVCFVGGAVEQAGVGGERRHIHLAKGGYRDAHGPGGLCDGLEVGHQAGSRHSQREAKGLHRLVVQPPSCLHPCPPSLPLLSSSCRLARGSGSGVEGSAALGGFGCNG